MKARVILAIFAISAVKNPPYRYPEPTADDSIAICVNPFAQIVRRLSA